MISIEDNLNERHLKWKTTSMDDDLNGRQHYCQRAAMEEGINQRGPQSKTLSMEGRPGQYCHIILVSNEYVFWLISSQYITHLGL